MSLITLFNNPPRTQAELEEFLIANEAHHNQVFNAVLKLKQQYLINLPLRPLDRNDIEGWLVRHSTMHQQTNDVLNLGSNDLMVLDFGGGEQAANFFYLHAQEHRAWDTALGM